MKSNIRRLRNEMQITQAELAHIIGKTQQAVSQMEQDRERISVGSLITMADYFNVSTDYIIGISTERQAPIMHRHTVSESEWVQKETEAIMRVIENGDDRLLYELIFSLLLSSAGGSSVTH